MTLAADPDDLFRRAAAGDAAALGDLFERHRDRLRRMVRGRLDPRLRGRVDPSDVLQDAFLEAAGRFDDFARDAPMPFFLWLRFLAAQRLLIVHRRHLGAKARDARRECPPASTDALADALADPRTPPADAAVKAESRAALLAALDRLADADREILALRHFEQLTNAEAAAVLGLRPPAASQRYARALLRLRDALRGPP